MSPVNMRCGVLAFHLPATCLYRQRTVRSTGHYMDYTKKTVIDNCNLLNYLLYMSVHVQNSRMTTAKLRQMKASGEKIAMLTSYDFTLARLVDEAGIDMLLVGDSASNVVCGNQYTLPITVDEMIFLTKGVRRAAQHALVVCDMPFGSYQVSEEEAVRNAIKILKESGCDAVT